MHHKCVRRSPSSCGRRSSPLLAVQLADFYDLWECTNEPHPRFQLDGERPLLFWHASNLRYFGNLAAVLPPAAEPPCCLCLLDCSLQRPGDGLGRPSPEWDGRLAQFTGLYFLREQGFTADFFSPSTTSVAALLEQMPNLQCLRIPDDSYTFRRTALQPFLDHHPNHDNLKVLPALQV